MPKQSIYIIRHGETYLNYYSRLQGWSNAPLTPWGISDVEASARGLKDIKFTATYTSDLQRTVDTAEIILSQNQAGSNQDITQLKDLREVFCGKFDGGYVKSVAEEVAEALDWSDSDYFWTLDDKDRHNALHQADPENHAENHETFLTRLKRGFNEIIDQHKNEDANIMIVVHGGVIRTLIGDLFPEFNDFNPVLNASVTELTHHNNELELITYATTDHFLN